MKKLFSLILAITVSWSAWAQESEKKRVKNVIEAFFKGFHAQDTLLMKSVLANKLVLQTTGRSPQGKTRFRTEKIETLMNSITSIPDSVVFEEKLRSWSIQVDRNMANAWIGYEFWLNGQLSHCGVNSFQLIDFDGEWKIIYLIDTRGSEGCSEE